MADDDYCYLTTRGRRTGQPHRIEIWYAAEGPTLYLLSGAGRSADWVRNLTAAPEVTVEIGDQVLIADARIVEADPAAAVARSLVFAKYAPRQRDDLSGWRDEALPVALDVRPS